MHQFREIASSMGKAASRPEDLPPHSAYLTSEHRHPLPTPFPQRAASHGPEQPAGGALVCSGVRKHPWLLMRRAKVASCLVSQCDEEGLMLSADRSPYTCPPPLGCLVLLTSSQHRGPETGQSRPSSGPFLGAFGVLSQMRGAS